MACDDGICVKKTYTFVSTAVETIGGQKPGDFSDKVKEDAQRGLDGAGRTKVDSKEKGCDPNCHCEIVFSFPEVEVKSHIKQSVLLGSDFKDVAGTLTRKLKLSIGSCEPDEFAAAGGLGRPAS
jgi:hypothetical protein